VGPGARWHLSISPTLVLVRSANAAALAQIRLTNVAKPLPYGSGETKGELPLRGQSEREALRVCLSTQLANDATHLPTVRQAARKYCCAVSRAERRRRSSLCLQKECSVCFSFSNLLASFGLSISFYLTKLECSSTSRPVIPHLSHPHCILTILRVHLSSDLQGKQFRILMEMLETVSLLAARRGCRDCPDNPEGTTYPQAEYGTPEGSHCCDQIAREAEERNDHAPWEASKHTRNTSRVSQLTQEVKPCVGR
jgi:hypothetical protein